MKIDLIDLSSDQSRLSMWLTYIGADSSGRPVFISAGGLCLKSTYAMKPDKKFFSLDKKMQEYFLSSLSLTTGICGEPEVHIPREQVRLLEPDPAPVTDGDLLRERCGLGLCLILVLCIIWWMP